MAKYIVVTGGAGYIGSHTVVSLIEKPNFQSKITHYKGDTKDIINQIAKTHSKSARSIEKFSKHLIGDSIQSTLK